MTKDYFISIEYWEKGVTDYTHARCYSVVSCDLKETPLKVVAKKVVLSFTPDLDIDNWNIVVVAFNPV